MPPLRTQLRQLIDSVHGGSVNKAAREIGVPQATLARMVDGRVTNPKAESLRPIAAYYGATIDWLLTGEGPGPDPSAGAWGFGGEVTRRWDALVDSLGLDGGAKGLMLNLPTAIRHAASSMPHTRTPLEMAQLGFEQIAREQEPLYRAARLEKEAWALVLSTWIDWWGVDAVRDALQSPEGLEQLREGFRNTRVLNKSIQHAGATRTPAAKPAKPERSKAAKRRKRGE